MEDEEKILLQRESLKYEERINKKKIREIMFRSKVKGYNQVTGKCVVYLKVFLGYINEIGQLNNPKLINSIICCIHNDNFCNNLELIMKERWIITDKIISLFQGDIES